MGSQATDAYVGIAPDGAGKKVATKEFTRPDGTVVETQVVLQADPLTGLPLDAPPNDEIKTLLRMILVELKVHSFLLLQEIFVDNRSVEELRNQYLEELP